MFCLAVCVDDMDLFKAIFTFAHGNMIFKNIEPFNEDAVFVRNQICPSSNIGIGWVTRHYFKILCIHIGADVKQTVGMIYIVQYFFHPGLKHFECAHWLIGRQNSVLRTERSAGTNDNVFIRFSFAYSNVITGIFFFVHYHIRPFIGSQSMAFNFFAQ